MEKQTPKQYVTVAIPEPEMPLPLPDAGNSVVVNVEPSAAVMPDSIPGAGDVLRTTLGIAAPTVPDSIPGAGNEVRVTTMPPLPSLSDIPASPDTGIPGIVIPSPDMAIVPDAGDVQRLVRSIEAPDIRTIDGANDEVRLVRSPEAPQVTSVPDAGNELRLVRDIPAPSLSDIPTANDTASPGIVLKSPDMAEIAGSGDAFRAVSAPLIPVMPEIPSPQTDDRYQRFETTFDGKLITDATAINIGAKNFQTLQNWRYTDYGLEGVDGYTRINDVDGSNIGTAGQKLKSGIQLRTNYSQASYIIVAAEDSSNTEVNTLIHEAVVPGTGAFTGANTITVDAAPANTMSMNSLYGAVPSGDRTITIAAGTYAFDELADLIAAAMNADTWLNADGGITFTCAYGSPTARQYNFTATGGTIAYTHEAAKLGAEIGFTGTKALAATLTTDTASTPVTATYDNTSATQPVRFSHLPNGQIGVCDGASNLIWAGEEMPVGAFLVTKSDTLSTSNLYTNGCFDYTERANNTGTSAQDTIPIQPVLSFGGTTTQFDITGSGDNRLYTYDGTGTAPLFVTNGLKTGMRIVMNAQNFNAANNGTFTVVAVSETAVTVANAQGVVESNKTIGTGSITTLADMFLIGSTRKLSAVKFTINTANTLASLMTVFTYTGTGSSWTSCMTTDNTASDGKTLAVNGTITISDQSPVPVIINGFQLYFYCFKPATNCNAIISQVTVQADIQGIVSQWDGMGRTALLAYVYRTTALTNLSHDCIYTLDIVDNSYSDNATGMELGGLPTTDYAVLAFRERCSGFIINMCSKRTNDPATPATMYVYYWNGSSWQQVPGLVDGTFAVTSLVKDGMVTWDYINPEYERKSEYRGASGYLYKIMWSAQLDNSPTNTPKNVMIDTLKGIPAPTAITSIYGFSHLHRNRAFWVDCISDGERNRADYSPPNAPDVYNGEQASGTNHERSLYFGGFDRLIGAVELYNQFGNTIDTVSLFFKHGETYLLNGDAPENFQVFKVSGSIGCPAPYSIDTAEVITPNGNRNVAVWCSDKGPMLFDGSGAPIPLGEDIRNYFDPAQTTTCVPAAYMYRIAGRVDPKYNCYHLLIPSGSSATVCNKWFVYDFLRQKWFEILPTVDFPQFLMRVEDQYGNKHLYGLSDTGYLLRCNNGRLWSTSSYEITHTVKTGDAMFSQSMWDETDVTRLKLIAAASTDADLQIDHYGNGSTAASSVTTSATIALGTNYNTAFNKSGATYRNLIMQLAKTTSSIQHSLRGLSHSFKFTVTDANTTKPRLLGWGCQYQVVREDSLDQGLT